MMAAHLVRCVIIGLLVLVAFALGRATPKRWAVADEPAADAKDESESEKRESIYGALFFPGGPHTVDVTLHDEDVKRGFVTVAIFQTKGLVSSAEGKSHYVATMIGCCRANADRNPQTDVQRKIRDELNRYIWFEALINKDTGEWTRVRTDNQEEFDRLVPPRLRGG